MDQGSRGLKLNVVLFLSMLLDFRGEAATRMPETCQAENDCGGQPFCVILRIARRSPGHRAPAHQAIGLLGHLRLFLAMRNTCPNSKVFLQ